MKMLVEFYEAGDGPLIASLRADACPDVGEKVNILGKNWLIVSRCWCVDYSDMAHSNQQMRACLHCEPTDDSLSSLSHEKLDNSPAQTAQLQENHD